MARVAYAQVYVSDMKRAIDFWGKLGIGVQDQSDEFPEFVTLKTDGAALALNAGEPDNKALMGRKTGITLVVPNLQKMYEEAVGRGVKFSGEPAAQPWGGVMTDAIDPDGNAISLLQDWENQPQP